MNNNSKFRASSVCAGMNGSNLYTAGTPLDVGAGSNPCSTTTSTTTSSYCPMYLNRECQTATGTAYFMMTEGVGFGYKSSQHHL